MSLFATIRRWVILINLESAGAAVARTLLHLTSDIKHARVLGSIFSCTLVKLSHTVGILCDLRRSAEVTTIVRSVDMNEEAGWDITRCHGGFLGGIQKGKAGPLIVGRKDNKTGNKVDNEAIGEVALVPRIGACVQRVRMRDLGPGCNLRVDDPDAMR